jgi:hypothetical protein
MVAIPMRFEFTCSGSASMRHLANQILCAVHGSSRFLADRRLYPPECILFPGYRHRARRRGIVPLWWHSLVPETAIQRADLERIRKDEP